MIKDMKKIYSFMLSAVAVLAAASCAQIEQNLPQEPAGETVTFTATTDATKTVLVDTDEVNATEWVSGDKITIHNGTSGYEFTTADAGSRAVFSYVGTDFSGEKFMAVYPAGTYEADVQAKTVKANIPTYQASRSNTYNEGAALAVAYTESNSLAFKNASALLKFTVKGNNIKGVIFYGHNGEAVSGDVLVTLDAEGKIASVVPQETTITENDVTETKFITHAKIWAETENYCFAEETTYYLAVVPQTFDKGFTVQLEVDGVGNKDVKKLETSYELKPNTILNIGELEYVEPDVTDLVWGVCGSMTSWGNDADLPMTLEGDWNVAKNVKLEANSRFKFRANGSWDINRGLENENALAADTEANVWNDGKDIAAAVPAVYDIYLSKNADKVKLVKVGDLEGEEPGEDLEVDPAKYGLVGTFQGWDKDQPIEMELAADGWIVKRAIELFKSDEFKFIQDKSWDVSYGTSSVAVLEEGKEIDLVTSGSQNMKVAKNGKFDIYFNPNAKKVKVECVEDYADIMVNIIIDNKANWSPLNITLKCGDEVIADKAVVTNNTFAVSGKYIGESLTYSFTSGTKTSDPANVTITKTGATVTLEETIVKLKVQLNTNNSKQWWGSTMKIHVWDTGTSFDTSWPGNTMTSEGNYTWSIIVPSELVGKTIKYLVHNGNGWQSKDSQVTIKAEGVTVTGSAIGIN